MHYYLHMLEKVGVSNMGFDWLTLIPGEGGGGRHSTNVAFWIVLEYKLFTDSPQTNTLPAKVCWMERL